MTEPIDFIDLTKDSPGNKVARTRSRDSESTTSRSMLLKSRRHNTTKRGLARHEDSVILEVPDEIPAKIVNQDKGENPMGIINLDDTIPSETNGMYYVNDNDKENLVVLTCPICYEHLNSKIKPMATNCGHIFCAQCLKKATQKVKKCPTCQTALKVKSLTRLYL